MKKLLFAFLALAFVLPAQATTRYVAQTAGTFTGGTACNGQTAITVATWNGVSLAAGDLTWICGTITIGTNATGFNFGSHSGTSGNPITLRFDTGAILQSVYFASSTGGVSAGAITLGNGNSYLTVDGNNVGTIQNTGNGSPPTYANQQPSTGISGFSCGHCIVENLTISNLYVNISGDGTLGDNSVVRAIDYNGSNWTISGNTIHDCGWCLFDAYNNGDTNEQVFNNNVYDMGHGQLLATAGSNSCTAPCMFLHDNHIHDANNWSAPGCPFHQDGLHAFGIPSGSSMDGVYVYNNLFDGAWGTCPTGFVFVEDGSGGGSTPAHMKNSYWWNNVMIVGSSSSGFVNTNGWFNVSSGDSGVQQFYNNTITGLNDTDNTNCFVVENLSSFTFKNNLISNCGNPIYIVQATTITSVDYNFYGPSCQNGGNCFIIGGTDAGSFSSWKTLCSCDSHGVQNNTPKLNANGSLQAGSPAIGIGLNLTTVATGNLSSLQNGTSDGNSITPVPRPTGVTAWDDGAFPTGSGPAPPTGVGLGIIP